MALATKPKRNTTTHKKRAGKHHRKSDSYLKTYWPYIPMLLIVGVGLIFNSLWSNNAVLGAATDFSSDTLLEATNKQRLKKDEQPLALNQQLGAAAQVKADDMAKRNYWSHDTPDGQTAQTLVTSTGYSYQATGENLAYGFEGAKDTVAGWMNSPAHRDNLLSANYKDVGFGIAQSLNYQGQGPATIVVAEYGQPTGSGATTIGSTARAIESQPVSRVQLLTGQSAWITIAVSVLAGAALAIFFIRHGLYFKRRALEGQAYISRHPLLDITLVFIGALAIIFAQASGNIH